MWIEANQAFYVIGSHRSSGMQTDEAIPFGKDEAAQGFAAGNGGRIVCFADMPRDYILPAPGEAR